MEDESDAMEDVQPTSTISLPKDAAASQSSTPTSSWSQQFTFTAKPPLPRSVSGTKRHAVEDISKFSFPAKRAASDARPSYNVTPPTASNFDFQPRQPFVTTFTPSPSPVQESRRAMQRIVWGKGVASRPPQQTRPKITLRRSLILDLPRELRDMIYECCMAVPGVIVIRGSPMQWDDLSNTHMRDSSNGIPFYCTYKPPSCFKNPPSPFNRSVGETTSTQSGMDAASPANTEHDHGRYAVPTRLSKVKGLLPALLQTCKQIHEEASRILYGHTFEFSQPHGSFLKLQTLSINTLAPTYAPLIKTMRFHFWWTSFTNTRATWRPFCEAIWGGIKQLRLLFPNLRTFTIVMGKRGRHNYPWEPKPGLQIFKKKDESPPTTMTVTELKSRLWCWFFHCFTVGTSQIPEFIEFELEDEDVDRKVVREAWKAFKERHNELVRQRLRNAR